MISKQRDEPLTPDPLSHGERGAEGGVRGIFNQSEEQRCHYNF